MNRDDTDTIEPKKPAIRIVAIVPCHNEAEAISKVVGDLKSAVPGIVVYVYDNASTDDTAAIARSAGANVRHVAELGKGNVVRRALADIDADVYVLIDGDDTYDAYAAPALIDKLFEGPFDHVTGVRRQITAGAFRAGHAFGNNMFNRVVQWIFASPATDMLSGYRVFSRRFVKSFPAVSRSFEIETELTVHAIRARLPQAEIDVDFKDRAEGTVSKLRTVQDGFSILAMIGRLAWAERPLLLSAIVALLVSIAGLILGIPVIADYLETGLVPRLPTALLSTALILISILMLIIGFLLSGLRQVRSENIRTAYLSIPAPPTLEVSHE